MAIYDPSNGGQNAANFAPGGYYNPTPAGPPAGQTADAFAPGGYYNPTGQYGAGGGSISSQPMYPTMPAPPSLASQPVMGGPYNPNPTPKIISDWGFQGGPYVPQPIPDFTNVGKFQDYINLLVPQQPVGAGGSGGVFGGGYSGSPSYTSRGNMGPMPVSQVLERFLRNRQSQQGDPLQRLRAALMQRQAAGANRGFGPRY